MAPEELLQRIAVSLRREIGPAVPEAFARTQAFMAAVILEKLARQLRAAAVHDAADRADLRDLSDALTAALQPGDPAALRSAVGGSDGAVDLSAVVRALYAEREALGAVRFERLLARVRSTLRARLDRRLEYAS